jgi:hypothetical protein
MKFTLEKSPTSDHAVTRFDVRDAAGSLVGRINVPPEQSSDLVAHWKDTPRPASNAVGKRNPMVGAMVRAAAARKHPLSKQAVLRGCC